MHIVDGCKWLCSAGGLFVGPTIIVVNNCEQRNIGLDVVLSCRTAQKCFKTFDGTALDCFSCT